MRPPSSFPARVVVRVVATAAAVAVAAVAVVVVVVIVMGVTFVTVARADGASGGGPGGGAPPRAATAGAAACRACHAAASRAWETSAHALTLREARAGALPPDVVSQATVAHAPGSSAFRRDGDRFLATTLGPEAKPATIPIEYVVGYRRLRMLVGRVADGRLQVLPAMREEPSGRWFDYTHLLFGGPELDPEVPPLVAPGDDSFWTGPSRSFDARCVRCHASGSERREPKADGRGPRSAWRAPAVDCEACHGPCAEHAAFWAALPRDRTKDPIAKSKTSALDRDAALDLCFRCHLEGDVVRARDGAGGAEGGASDPDVLPTLLDDVVRVDATGRPLELIYDGLPFSTSTCARRGELTCLTCHDAHGSANPSQLKAAADGTSACVGCHADVAAASASHAHHRATGPGGSCVGCHMPLVTIERGHGAVRDHTIGIPRPRAGGPRAAADACTSCHGGGRGAPPGAPRIPPEKILAAYESWWPSRGPRPYWTAAIEAGRAADAGALPALDEILGASSLPPVVKASAARLLKRFPAQALSRCLALANDDDAWVRSGAAFALSAVRGAEADAALLAALSDRSAVVRREAARAVLEGWERAQENRALLAAAIPVLEADAAVVPDDDRRWFLVGSAKQIAGDWKGAVVAFERQLALDPHAANVRAHLDVLRRAAGGDRDGAHR